MDNTYKIHRVNTLPTSGDNGDWYILKKDNRHEIYIVKPNGSLLFNKGISDLEQNILKNLTIEDTIKLNELKTQSEINTDINISRQSAIQESEINLLQKVYTKQIVDTKINDVSRSVIGKITTTQTLTQLNLLPDGIYESETSGLYANGITAKEGYSTKFEKKVNNWTLFSEVLMPTIPIANESGTSISKAISQNFATDLKNTIYSSESFITPVYTSGKYYSSSTGILSDASWSVASNKIKLNTGETELSFYNTNNQEITGIRLNWWRSDGSFGGSPAPIATNKWIIPSGADEFAFNAATSSQSGYVIYTLPQIQSIRVKSLVGGNSITKLKNDVNILNSQDKDLKEDIDKLEDLTDIIKQEQSINLADKSKIIIGKTISYNNGNIVNEGASRMLIIPLPKLNSNYSIVGFLGNSLHIYNNSVDPNNLESFNSSNRVQRIGVNGPNVNQYEFNSLNDGYYALIRISTGSVIYDDTVMLYEGTLSNIPDYVPYINSKGIEWKNIIDKPVIPKTQYNNCYYNYNINTGETSSGRFSVYSKLKEDLYVGFNIDHIINSSIRADLWRIRDTYLYKYDGSSMISQNQQLLLANENEYVYKIKGASDHTGGFHGDEILTDVRFFVDNILIPITSNIPLSGCNTFSYNQISNTYNPEDISSDPTIVAIHRKKTTIENGSYHTYNKLEFKVDSVIVDELYGGLSCIMSSVCNNFYSKSLNIIPRNSDNTFKVNESGSIDKYGTIYYYNNITNISAKCTSSWEYVTKNNLDSTSSISNSSQLRVWDRTSDSKYYHRNVLDNIFNLNDMVQSNMVVSFSIK